MIKLTYAELNSGNLNEALHALSNQTCFANFQAGWNVSRIIRQYQNEVKQVKEAYKTWATDYFDKDEKGELIAATPEMQTPYTPWKIKDGKSEEFVKKMEEFFKVEITLESSPINPEDLTDVKLTPIQIMALEPLLHIPRTIAQ